MKKSIGILFALVAAAGTLAACNSSTVGGSSSSGGGGNCGGPPNQLQVLYPIPNTKKAPPALANIYVSTKGQLPPSNSFNFYLVQSNGFSTFTSILFGINKAQIPSPHATPSYNGAVYYASSLPSSYVIGPNQSVALLWNDGGTGCTPHTQVSSFATKN